MRHHESLNDISKKLSEVHEGLTRARSVSEIHEESQSLHRYISNVSFKRTIHELGDSGQHLYILIEKAQENMHKSHRVSDAKKCLVLLESAQHAVREEIHKLHNSHSHKHH